jgi:signal transduction histidine kinase
MLPLAAVALASLMAVGLINARMATRETRAAIGSQLQGVVGVLESSNFPLTDKVLKQLKGLTGADFVLVNEERIVSSSQSSLSQNLPDVDQDIADDNFALGPRISIGHNDYFHSVLQLERPLGNADPGTLHILFPLQRYNETWQSAFLPPLLVGTATIIAVALVTHWIASRISRNLAALGTSVERLAGGNFQPLAVPIRDDEVRDLTVAVNRTATRLSEYEQHLRQTEQMRTVAMLGAGLAHEIKNAATGCRLAVDLHAEECLLSPSDDTLAVAKSQLQLMENRLQGFLQYGKEQSNSQASLLDLSILVGELVPLVLPAARHAGVKIEWQRTHNGMFILGRRDALGMVVVNLLLNAIEAAQKNPPSYHGPSVGIELAENNHGFIILEVNDSGAGLSSELAERLFQPFVSTKPEGVGLGLAVAQQVAKSHGGEIRWSRDNNRTRFQLSLPQVGQVHTSERNGSHAKDFSRR